MSEALAFGLMALLVVLLAAMPWRRPHPNHQFVLELLRLLESCRNNRNHHGNPRER